MDKAISIIFPLYRVSYQKDIFQAPEIFSFRDFFICLVGFPAMRGNQNINPFIFLYGKSIEQGNFISITGNSLTMLEREKKVGFQNYEGEIWIFEISGI